MHWRRETGPAQRSGPDGVCGIITRYLPLGGRPAVDLRLLAFLSRPPAEWVPAACPLGLCEPPSLQAAARRRRVRETQGAGREGTRVPLTHPSSRGRRGHRAGWVGSPVSTLPFPA